MRTSRQECPAHGPHSPERIWTGIDGGVATASPRLAAEMEALGDTLVEYVRADVHRGGVDALHEAVGLLDALVDADDLPLDVGDRLDGVRRDARRLGGQSAAPEARHA